MKKFLTTIIAAALLVSSAGCRTTQPQATQSAPEPAPQALILNVTPPTDTSEKHIDMSAVIEQITAGLKVKLDTAEKKKETTQATKEESKAAEQEKTQEPQNKPEMRQSNPTAEPRQETPATEPDAYLKVTVETTPTPPPAATPAPTPAPTPEPPAPTPAPPVATPEPVQPTPEPVPSFDIGYWIGYAQSCAQGLGLRLESSAVDCWDNPIGAGPHSTCLERDISSRMNRYSNDPDITDVWIWYESTGNDCYNIYIGYA